MKKNQKANLQNNYQIAYQAFLNHSNMSGILLKKYL